MAEEVDMADPRRNRPPSLGELRSRRDAILEIAQRHGVLDMRVFGPVARSDGPVDVVTPAALQERVRIKVSREAVPL